MGTLDSVRQVMCPCLSRHLSLDVFSQKEVPFFPLSPVFLISVPFCNLVARPVGWYPLYGIREWEQQIALARAGDQRRCAFFQIPQLQQAIADLETVVREHRSERVSPRLSTVSAKTQASQEAVHALPKGASRVAMEQRISMTLVDERTAALAGRLGDARGLYPPVGSAGRARSFHYRPHSLLGF